MIEFRDRRDWAKYHNPKDLAISLSLEAAELLEIFQWKDPDEVEALKANETGFAARKRGTWRYFDLFPHPRSRIQPGPIRDHS